MTKPGIGKQFTSLGICTTLFHPSRLAMGIFHFSVEFLLSAVWLIPEVAALISCFQQPTLLEEKP